MRPTPAHAAVRARVVLCIRPVEELGGAVDGLEGGNRVSCCQGVVFVPSHRRPAAAPSWSCDTNHATPGSRDKGPMGVIADASQGGLRRGCVAGAPCTKSYLWSP